MNWILADKQDITRFAIQCMVKELGTGEKTEPALSMFAVKNALAENLGKNVVIVMDYSQFDTTEEELLLLHARYPEVRFLLFSEQLSRDFLRRILLSNRMFSVVLKDSPLREIMDALDSLGKGRQYISTDVQMLIDTPERPSDRSPLSKTEKDILKLMAMGKKSKQIAEERFLSVHTVVTHRKNIFRKLNVNNAQEAIRYALRAGIVDPLEYYI